MKDKRWFRLLLFLPIRVAVAATNYFVDPAGIYHSDSRFMAQALLEGNQVYFDAGNGDERGVKQYLITEMPPETECVTVGPSLVFGIRADTAGTDSYYNLGISGADFYDILAQFGLMEVYGKQYDRVIFCVDSYFFDETLFGTFSRNETLRPYADYMLGILDGKEMKVPEENGFARAKARLSQLFSITYFQSCVSFAGTRGLQAVLERVTAQDSWGIAGEDYQGTYYARDGSLVYALEYQQNTADFVREEAQNYDIEKMFSKNGHISPYCEEMFEKMIQYLQRKGVEVDLYLCPLAPSLWDRIDQEEYYILSELEAFAHDMAGQYGLKITGSYDPYRMQMTDEDFYDSRHVRHELLESFFDFTAQ